MCADGPAAAERDPAPFEAALHQGSWACTVMRVREDGERLALSMVVTALHDGTGLPFGFLTLSRDISRPL